MAFSLTLSLAVLAVAMVSEGPGGGYQPSGTSTPIAGEIQVSPVNVVSDQIFSVTIRARDFDTWTRASGESVQHPNPLLEIVSSFIESGQSLAWSNSGMNGEWWHVAIHTKRAKIVTIETVAVDRYFINDKTVYQTIRDASREVSQTVIIRPATQGGQVLPPGGGDGR